MELQAHFNLIQYSHKKKKRREQKVPNVTVAINPPEDEIQGPQLGGLGGGGNHEHVTK